MLNELIFNLREKNMRAFDLFEEMQSMLKGHMSEESFETLGDAMSALRFEEVLTLLYSAFSKEIG